MIWDRFVRIFHWSLAAGILLNYWVLEAGDPPHEWLGYSLMALVGARILWGFIGSQPARFANFVVGPGKVIHNIRHFAAAYQQHRGHSPLAGWMILTLLTLTLATGFTGWLQEWDAFWGEEWPQTLHEWLANTLLAAAGVHVAAVLFIQWRFRVPLVRSMLPRSMWRG